MATTALSPAPHTYLSLRAAWIPLTALCLAFFVEMVDNTLLTIALPTIGRDLASGTTALQWVTGATPSPSAACCSPQVRWPTESAVAACSWSASPSSVC